MRQRSALFNFTLLRPCLGCIALAGALLAAHPLSSQEPTATAIREPKPRRVALRGLQIIPRPGEVIDDGIILIRDGMIEAVGANVEIPAGYEVLDRNGMRAYPGLIESALLVRTNDLASAASSAPGASPNANVVSQVDVTALTNPLGSAGSELRSQGFATAWVLPADRIIRGHGSVMHLSSGPKPSTIPGGETPLVVGLDLRNTNRASGYPSAEMGLHALVRQAFSDGAWHAQARDVFAKNPGEFEAPIHARALEALDGALSGTRPVVFDATSALRVLRGARMADDFDLAAIFLAGGESYLRAEEIAACDNPLIVPVNFPKKPQATSLSGNASTTLRTLLMWKHAPENAKRLIDAGCTIALSTHRLEKRDQFRANLAKAIEAGLTEEEALRGLTQTPAQLLGIESQVGELTAGRIANVLVVEGNYFKASDPIRELWIAGERHEIKARKPFDFPPNGTLAIGDLQRSAKVNRAKNQLEVTEVLPPSEDEEDTEAAKPKAWSATNLAFTDQSITGVLNGEAFDTSGPVRFDLVLADGVLEGAGETATGDRISFQIVASDDIEADKTDVEEEKKESATPTLQALPTPLGAYGRLAAPQVENLLFEHATIWTCAEQGILHDAQVLIENGTVRAVGNDLNVPQEVTRIDATGMHITPGLIDCHSHTGIEGGINDGSQNNTSEVRIADILNPDDIDWYRQLAGGLTCANQLHGSANPIGGQNAVVKLRWGAPVNGPNGMHFKNAMPGIKFALGENVVRSRGRYPDTRMGVAAFLEDSFRTASEYLDAHAAYDALSDEERASEMPVQRDFELETIGEILRGERIIHCHSYRQDEILMLLRTAERWGFTIGTLQHVLEGYKIAAEIAEHGAGASSFSDWWAYKMEVMDAVPHNGSIMANAGVLVSFNSDSDELARRMNTEAAKAVRYGSLSPEEALKFVTINPARQLRIDDRVGSLEVGKDADLVLWSGDPLSTYTRCLQTYIDGRRYFDHNQDIELAQSAQRQRAQLLAQLADSKYEPPDDAPPSEPATADAPTRPLARLLWAHQEALFELVRRGADPKAVRPGDCGLDQLNLTEERAK